MTELLSQSELQAPNISLQEEDSGPNKKFHQSKVVKMNRTKVFRPKFFKQNLGKVVGLTSAYNKIPFQKFVALHLFQRVRFQKLESFTISKTDRHLLRTSKSSYKKRSYKKHYVVRFLDFSRNN